MRKVNQASKQQRAFYTWIWVIYTDNPLIDIFLTEWALFKTLISSRNRAPTTPPQIPPGWMNLYPSFDDGKLLLNATCLNETNRPAEGLANVLTAITSGSVRTLYKLKALVPGNPRAGTFLVRFLQSVSVFRLEPSLRLSFGHGVQSCQSLRLAGMRRIITKDLGWTVLRTANEM
jgi:hypothetical protein